MKKPSIFLLFLLFSGLFSTSGCDETLDVTAPPQDVWVVYSILQAQADTQYVRVAKAFLTDGNALVYARENDLSQQGMQVTLTGGGRTYTAFQLDEVPKEGEGDFVDQLTLYGIATAGSQALQPGTSYTLTVTRPDEPSLELTAQAVLPEAPTVSRPVPRRQFSQEFCLDDADLYREFRLEFRASPSASAYEVRGFLNYQEAGESRQAIFGPTNLFEGNQRCQGSSSSLICYQFSEKAILRSFDNQMDRDPNLSYTYGVTSASACNLNVDALPQALVFEVTALDQQLYQYLRANNPAFSDLNTVRREYTNFGGTAEVIGIFGAISTAQTVASLDDCSLYLLGLNGANKPAGQCEW